MQKFYPHQLPQGFVQDSSYGWLLSHQNAMQNLGVVSDYHLRKHFQKLIVGQHYLKRQDPDNVNRLYYTLDGLKLLCEFARTPQSYQFAQQLQSLESSPVPALPSYGESTRNPSPLAIHQGEFVDEVSWQDSSGWDVPGNLAPASPAELGWLSPDPSPAPPAKSQTQADVEAIASVIFEGQRIVKDSMLSAQQQQYAHAQFALDSVWAKADDFLKNQDNLTMQLIAAGLITIAALGTYALVVHLTEPSPRQAAPVTSYQ